MSRGVLDASGAWTTSGIAALEALESNLTLGITSTWKGDLAKDDTTDAALTAWLRATVGSQNIACVDGRARDLASRLLASLRGFG